MLDLANEMDIGYLYITHDLAVARYIYDQIAVMYLGKIAGIADTEEQLANPLHPYTRVLLSAISVPDPLVERTRQHLLMDPTLDYGEPDSRLTEVSTGHWLAAARCAVDHTN